MPSVTDPEATEPPYFYRDPRATPEERQRGIIGTLRLISIARRDQSVTYSFTESPKTDGRTIWLGAIAADDPDLEPLALGHGIHETMHVLATDMMALNKLNHITPFMQSLINVLEDIRIDSLGMTKSESYAPWREAMALVLEKRHQLAVQSASRQNPATALCLWLHMELASELPFRWTKRYLPTMRDIVKKSLPQNILSEILSVARGAANAANTSEIIELAGKIESILKTVCSKDKKSSGKATRHRPSRSDANTSAVPKMKAAAPSGADTETQQFLSAVLGKENSCPRELGLAYFIHSNETSTATDDHAVRASVRKGDANSDYVAKDWPDKEDMTDNLARSDIDTYTKQFDANLSSFLQLTAAFEKAFRTPAEENEDAAATGTVTAHDIALRVKMRNPRLFAAPAPVKTVRGELIILLDRSGSMGVSRMTRAKIAVASLWRAATKHKGIRKTIGVFPGLGDAHVASLVRSGETELQFLNRFKGVGAYGSTPVNQALWWASDIFERAPATGDDARLLVVITDGDFPVSLAPELTRKFKTAHVEVAVLSIMTVIENQDVLSEAIHDEKAITQALVRLIEKTRFCKKLQTTC